jgi:peptidoglycan/xylan/chitin deacetylase (PgdA/CDA1 family)
MKDRVMVVFGFDMETDIGSWTPFFKGLTEGTPKILRVLSEKNVKATFFFTGEAAKKDPSIVRKVAEGEHEVGCHSLFHETVGEEFFPIPGLMPFLPEEAEFRLRKATEWVEEVLGDDVVSFRAPRLWGSTRMVCTLESLGYKADASYPLYYYGEQLAPYHPSRRDWTKKGDLEILEIPNFADMSIKSKDKYGRDRDQWPILRTEGADQLMTHVRNHVEYVRDRGLPVVLCFYFHPWEFTEMPVGPIRYSPEGSVLPDEYLTRNCGDYALVQLGRMIDILKSTGSIFMQAREVAEIWDTV